jgi:Mn2+/Fe2+ NRAMP family transporter
VQGEVNMPEWFWLPLAILLFGVIIIILVTVIVTKQSGWGTELSRIVGLLFVVVVLAFLVVASGANPNITKDVLTPAVGLLGAALGYLFGKT